MSISLVRSNTVGVGNGSVRLNINSENEQDKETESETSEAVTESVYHTNNEAVTIHNFLKKASEAVDAIGDLRTKQLELATEAEEAIDSETRANLDTEFDAIESQIQEIATNTTYNGEAVLSTGRTFVVQDKNKDIGEAISFSPGAVLFASDSTYDLTTSSGASTTVDTITAIRSSTTTLSSDVDSAYGKSADTLVNISLQELQSRIEDPEEVKKEQASAAIKANALKTIESLANRGNASFNSAQSNLVGGIKA